MAQLKSSVAQGSLRVTDTTYSTNINLASATASQAVVTDANKNLISKGITDNASSTALGTSDTNLVTARSVANAGYVKSSGVTSITIQTTSPITGGSSTATTGTGSYTIAHDTSDGNKHVPATGTSNNGKFLKAGSTAGSLSWGTAVTSVQVQATSPVTSSQNTAQTGTLNTTIALADNYGDTKNPYASKTKNQVLASGASADGAPSFRALVAADLPKATTSAIGAISVSTGLSVTTAGALSVVYGTGASKAVQGNQTLVTLNGSNKTAASLASFYAPTTAGTSGQYLKSSGSGAPTWDDPKVSISANVTTDEQYAIPFVTTGNDGTSPTAAKIEGLQKNTTKLYFNPNSGRLDATMVANAIWNDYAECRSALVEEPGRVITESKDGKMHLAEERLMPACKIISDTYGTIMGQSKEAKTPIAVAGRVLAYPYQNREVYELGAAVCSAPNGTVDIMTREEIREYPERILGTVSEIPNYDTWLAGDENNPKHIPINGRIWIYVR